MTSRRLSQRKGHAQTKKPRKKQGLVVVCRSLSQHVELVRKVEPGGIEPPSRDSQHDASTRVFADLISIVQSASDSIPAIQSQCFLIRGRCDATVGRSRIPCTPSRARDDLAEHVTAITQPGGPARSRSDQRQSRWHLWFCTLFYEACVHLDAPRHTSHVRSKPVGPSCQRSAAFIVAGLRRVSTSGRI